MAGSSPQRSGCNGGCLIGGTARIPGIMSILILGHSTDLTQPVRSMEINHQKIHAAGPGMEVALKVDEPVRKGDLVYKVVQPELASW